MTKQSYDIDGDKYRPKCLINIVFLPCMSQKQGIVFGGIRDHPAVDVLIALVVFATINCRDVHQCRFGYTGFCTMYCLCLQLPRLENVQMVSIIAKCYKL